MQSTGKETRPSAKVPPAGARAARLQIDMAFDGLCEIVVSGCMLEPAAPAQNLKSGVGSSTLSDFVGAQNGVQNPQFGDMHEDDLE